MGRGPSPAMRARIDAALAALRDNGGPLSVLDVAAAIGEPGAYGETYRALGALVKSGEVVKLPSTELPGNRHELADGRVVFTRPVSAAVGWLARPVTGDLDLLEKLWALPAAAR